MDDNEMTQTEWIEFEIDFIVCLNMMLDTSLDYDDARKQAVKEWKEYQES